MSTHDEVLDAIDQTLSDYEVSGDAMRWTPEPPPAGWRIAPVPWSHIDRPPLTLTITADVSRFQVAMDEVRATMGQALLPLLVKLSELGPRIAELKRQMEAAEATARRSALWSEYHRRQKRRNRR